MKNCFKFVPVALGLLALASCSDNEFLNEAPKAQNTLQEGDLVVNVEALEDETAVTRSYLSRDLSIRMYTNEDQIKVYDKDLHKYDIYAFSWSDDAKTTGTFRMFNTASNLDAAPAWAIYPKQTPDEQSGSWAYNEVTNNSETTLTSTIPGFIIYDGTYQTSDTEFNTPLYQDMLPRWGKVTAIDGGKTLETNLLYMTGVLRLQLNGTPDYVDGVRIKVKDGSNYLRINGQFTTTLSINDVMQTAQFAATAMGTGDTPGVDDAIYVFIPAMTDLKGDDAMKSVLFIPLVTTTKAVDIEVSFSNDLKSNLTNPTSATWGTIEGKTFKNKTIARAKVYGNSQAINFATDGKTPSAVSDALELEEIASGEDLILTTSNAITTTTTDNVIYIPNKDCKSITVDLSQGITASAADLIVKYKDVQGEGKYKNPVTIITGTAVAGNIDVQLDETPFTLAQGSTVFAANKIDANALTLTAAPGASASYTESNFTLSDNVKTLNVNGGATIDAITTFGKLTAVNVNEGGTVTGAITVNTPGVVATVTGKGNVNGSTIGGAITASGNISISEKCDATAGVIESKNGNVAISNVTQTALDYTKAVTASNGEVAISGNTKVSGAITAKTFKVTENATTKDVTVKGDATINIGYQGEAVSGTLTFNANAKLNLFSGYVATVDAKNKTVGLYHGETAAFTAIQTLKNYNKFSAKNVSKWNGAQIGTTPTDFSAYRICNTNEVWTASQLAAQIEAPTSFGLNTDVDLDNKDWKGINQPAADYDIQGNGFTISNVNLVGNDGLNSGYAAFIGYNANETNIDNLTLDGVKTTIKALNAGKTLKGVAGVIGRAYKPVTMTNVSVKLASGYFGSLNGTKNVSANNIGGLIGMAGVNAEVTLKGVTVDATGATLAGHHSIGGFIGSAANNVYISTIPEAGDIPEIKSAVTGLANIEVTLLDLGENENDQNQGKTGYYIGTADLSNTIRIADAANVKPTFTVGGKVDLSKAFTVTGAPAKMYLYSAGAQSLIGQSGLIAGGEAEINGVTYEVHLTSDTSTPNNVLYKVTVSNYQP